MVNVLNFIQRTVRYLQTPHQLNADISEMFENDRHSQII